MKFQMTLRFDDGRELEITAGSRDQLAWEKAAQNRATSQILSEGRIENYFSLAHAAAKRQGMFTGTLKEFEDSVELDLGHTISKGEDAPETDDADEHPTQPGPSDDH